MSCLEKLTEDSIEEETVLAILAQLIDKYQDTNYSFELVHINEGYHFLTKTAYHKTVSIFLNQKSKKRLSKSAMETLAIIAYKQPITKAEIEHIRGVSCDYSIKKLLEKELIAIAGRAEVIGKPILYQTSMLFMDYFGIASPKDLPKLKDIQLPKNAIGEVE